MAAALVYDAASRLFAPRIWAWLTVIRELTFCNPFSPELAACEQQALPFDELVDTGSTWCLAGASPAERPNAVRIRRRLRPVLDVARKRLASGFVPSREDRLLYEDACLHLLLGHHGAALVPFIDPKLHGEDDCMDDMHTLVLGDSGTGKELAAQALGRTGYVPFLVDERCFAAADGEHYHCLSLVERAATLLQGELFGYDAGAFTGADRDTPGWLELCPSGGRLFLDEIAELDVSLQPMLLRVIQSRTFQRQGGRKRRRFLGGIIAATNRDLRALIAEGKFREELYQRLAVDEIRMPALRDQLAGAPGDLGSMVLHIAVKIRGPEQGERLAAKAMEIIAAKRGPRYLWPGNFRELERTVRRIFLHDKDVHASPSTRRPAPATDGAAVLGRQILEGRMTMEEIERRVVLAVYEKTKSRRRGARLLDIDRERFAKRLREAMGEGTPDT